MLFLMFLLTIAAVLGVVYVASVLWSVLFVSSIPGVVSGLIGGLSALPIWEGLKSVRSKDAIENKK